MQPVIKPDGTHFNPPPQTGRGRKGKYPWRYLEIGDHFVAPTADLPSIRTLVATASMFRCEHALALGREPHTVTVTRTT